MNIIMLGKPGAGKGTVGKVLSQKLELTHISSGDLFRDYIKEAGEIGKEIQSYIEKGQLVPDELTIKFVEKRLKEDDCKKGAILDGYPRTIAQAEALDKFLEKNGQKVDIAINLDLSDEEIIERTSKRVLCSNKSCGEIYNLEFKKPKQEGICDICGSQLIQRDDDKTKTIKKRLEAYLKNTGVLVDYYKEKDILHNEKLSIYSTKTPSEIVDGILNK